MLRLLLFVAVVTAFLAACGGDNGSGSPTPGTLSDSDEALLEDTLRVTFHEQIDFGGQVSEPSAVRALGETGDQRFIPVLVDVLRFPWLLTVETKRATLTSLAQLRGLEYEELESHQLEGSWWLEWLRDHPEVEGPPGYGNWKGRLFGQLVDRRMADFFDATGPEPEVRLEEIVWGGVPRDGIPDLRQPPHVAAGDADYLNPDDRVFGLTLGGESRAYPLRIMNAHEMANDVLGGAPFALSYCTLCGSGIAYATDIGGEVLSFGTSGLLYRSNKLMYDRETETLWDQFRGVPLVGERVGNGAELEVLPLTLTSWREWLSLHPDTTVLDDDTGVYPASSYKPENDPGSIYFEYRANPTTIYPTGETSDLLPAKELVIGLNFQGEARAYALAALQGEAVLNDEVGGTEVVVIATDSGEGARAYERRGQVFSNLQLSGGELTVADESGARWRVDEDMLMLVDGDERLDRLESRVSYWFAWYQTFPQTSVYD